MRLPRLHRSLSIAVSVLVASIDNTILTMIPGALQLIGGDLGVAIGTRATLAQRAEVAGQERDR
ncbi:MAG TPA: hypothetical protein VGD58_31875 [Herpetosiphonaceae bacterium]